MHRHINVNPTTRLATLELAASAMTDVMALLRPELAVLSDEARAAQLRPPGEFTEVAPVFAQAMGDHPAVCAAAGFDCAQVLTQAACARRIDRMLAQMGELNQLLADTRLQALSDAWSASLDAYRVAKATENRNPTLRVIIDPMAEIFKARRSPTSATSTTVVAAPVEVTSPVAAAVPVDAATPA